MRYPTEEHALPRRSRGCACGASLPGMCPGPSMCPYNQPDPSDSDLAEAAGPLAFSAAEDLFMVLDRYPGDWGDEPDAITDITARIRALHEEALALLGPPRVRSATGCLVPAPQKEPAK